MSSSKTSGAEYQPDVQLDITKDDIDKWLRRTFGTPGNRGSSPAEAATREASSSTRHVAEDGSPRRRTTTATEEKRRPLDVFVTPFFTLLPRGPGHTGAFGLRLVWLEHHSPGFTLVVKRRLAPVRKSPPARDNV